LNTHVLRSISQHTATNYEESLEDALIDLYLSVKIRSNEEVRVIANMKIDNYNEHVLREERERLKETDPFTVLDYIKTSIEILMNMKMEEHETEQEKGKRLKKKAVDSEPRSLLAGDVDEESESDAGKDRLNDYDAMLGKYEAEVRNHIKIEQQLKLHIECVQDKLDEVEKQLKKEQEERVNEKSDIKKELDRYKDLLTLREKEIQQFKLRDTSFKRNEDVWKKKMSQLENEKKDLSSLLMKVQRSITPLKGLDVGSLDDLKPEDLVGESDELKANYS
jgi:archaellum component FlaC